MPIPRKSKVTLIVIKIVQETGNLFLWARPHHQNIIYVAPIKINIIDPLAMVTRLATEEQIYGTALTVGNEAIKYHQLYPEGTAPVY